MACYRIERGGIVIAVRLTPRGGRDAVEGVATLADDRDVLLARVRAVAEKGSANTALVALLADIFRRPKTDVRIIAGLNGRLKQVEIAGDSAGLAAIAAAFPHR
jgi:uncharacterized protein (TIGR00251 family)